MTDRLCRNCIHFEICGVANALDRFFTNLHPKYYDHTRDDELIDYVNAFAKFCQSYREEAQP